MGIVSGLGHINHRKPFFDNELVKFVFSLPDEYRRNNKLYSSMLLKLFPELFQDIPWQKTRENLNGTKSKVLNNVNVIRGYINYARGIREPSILGDIYDLLDYKKSKYKNFTKIDAVERYLTPHLESIACNNTENIFRFITTEYYLRKFL
jgi:hypothetical protein